jgi:phospholipid N-methyltransferase
MPVREHLQFFGRFLSSPRTVSAFAPSSKALADAMTDWIDWSAVENVAEYGAGTGALTEAISQRLMAGGTLISVEIDPLLADMAVRRVPSARVRIGSVTDIEAICAAEGVSTVDSVVSGLPWAMFDSERQREILTATLRILRPNGFFVTFAHPFGFLVPGGWHFRRLLEEHFVSVQQTPMVWRNFPPAFVYRCRTAAPISSR